MTAPALPRRALAGVLGFVAAAPTAAAPSSYRQKAEDQLASLLWRLMDASDAFDALPDDHPHQELIVERMDALAFEAALVTPDTDLAFGIKARIAQRFDACARGSVARYLLCDLIQRGGVGV